jgi:hypothetical protein
MKQDLHLGEMLKARLAEKQQPIQLNLFDDGDYVVHEVKHAMNLSLDAVYKLRDSNPHAFYRIKQIRDATECLRPADLGPLRDIGSKPSLKSLASLINQPGGFGPHLGDCYATTY